VDVGAEFTMAEDEARARAVPCACIDVDMDRLCNRLAAALIPTPCNLLDSALAWLALPRLLWEEFFPARGTMDLLGGVVLHAMSFRLRTCVAFILSALCAGSVLAFVLLLFGRGAEGAAEGTGIVAKQDRGVVMTSIMLATELYVVPRLHEAIAASRDEAMYQAIVARAHEHSATRLVAVVGAAHANGILSRAAARGL